MTSLVHITPENNRIYLEQILEIDNLSFSSPWTLRLFREEIENPISHLWGLRARGVLSGYACFWMSDAEIQLMNIAVHPHGRTKGLGYDLLRKIVEAAICKGIRSIWLEVRPSNSAAKRLYQKLGFEVFARRPRYYRHPNEDAMVMALNLLSPSFS